MIAIRATSSVIHVVADGEQRATLLGHAVGGNAGITAGVEIRAKFARNHREKFCDAIEGIALRQSTTFSQLDI